MTAMDTLNMADVLSTPWLPPYGQLDDGNYVPRPMLEPIIEETTDDEESLNAADTSWSQYDQAWSSESDTGSVIRVGLNLDQDTLSEREFACPAKRRKQQEYFDEDVVQLRHHAPAGRGNDLDFRIRGDMVDPMDVITKRFRLEDPSDSFIDVDALSFSSLSRSSSLIQFESLERQMQGDTGHHHHHQPSSTFGGSTPSLYSLQSSGFDTVDCKKRFSDQYIEPKMSRNYFDVEQIDFDKTLFLNGQMDMSRTQQNQNQFECSSSSENSLSSDGEITTTLHLHHRSAQHVAAHSDIRGEAQSLRCKNSVENLSEDSGYGEYNQLRQRSRSIPNFNQDHYLIEEEEFGGGEHLIKSMEHMAVQRDRDASTQMTTRRNDDEVDDGDERHDALGGGVKIRNQSTASRTTKIDATKSASGAIGATANSDRLGRVEEDEAAACPAVVVGQQRKTKSATLVTPPNISASLPDILEHVNAFDCSDREYHSRANRRSSSSSSPRTGTVNIYAHRPRSSRRVSDLAFDQQDFSIVSSVPSCLNICIGPGPSDRYDLDRNSSAVHSTSSLGGGVEVDFYNNTFGVGASKNSSHRPTSVASKNFDLCDLETAAAFGRVESAISGRQLKVINASYNNLTVLDYSGRRATGSSTFRAMAEQRKRNSGEFCKGNFLLDEISKHFDRNLSILNDRKENYDPEDRLLHQLSNLSEYASEPPVPPPRRNHAAEQVNHITRSSTSISSPINDLKPDTYHYTFDRDPTNLITAYAASLERCNFEMHSSSQNLEPAAVAAAAAALKTEETAVYNLKPSSSNKRELVSSTPNLCRYNADGVRTRNEDFLRTSSTHNSMNPIDGIPGILANGSRNSLGKGVSFCPIVSEISWKEQSSEEVEGDDEEYSSNNDDDDDYDRDGNEGDDYDDGDDDGDDDDSEYASHHRRSAANTADRSGDRANDSQPHTVVVPRPKQHSTTHLVQLERGAIDAKTTTTTTAHAKNSNQRDNDRQRPATQTATHSQHQHHQHQPNSNTNNNNRTDSAPRSTNTSTHSSSSGGGAATSNNNTNKPATISRRPQSTATAHSPTEADEASHNGSAYGAASTMRIVSENVSDTIAPAASAAAANATTTTTTIIQVKSKSAHQQSGETPAADNNQNTRSSMLDTSGQVSAVSGDVSASVNRKRATPGVGVSGGHDFGDTNHSGVTSANNNKTTTTTDDQSSAAIRPEKPTKQKGGFLSRFSGFRFSLRGGAGAKKKAAANSNNNNAFAKIENNHAKESATAQPKQPTNGRSNHNKSNVSDDFIYIPLKEPTSDHHASSFISSSATNSTDSTPNTSVAFRSTDDYCTSTPTHPHHQLSTGAAGEHVVVTTKPPLPKQPPRIVGVSAKSSPSREGSSSSGSPVRSTSSSVTTRSGGGHAQYRSLGRREIDEFGHNHADNNDYSSASSTFSRRRGDYDDGLLLDDDTTTATTANDDYEDDTTDSTVDDSRIDYYQRKQQQLRRAGHRMTTGGGRPAHAATAGSMSAMVPEHRIGLIETNLDTHETVISGKTRSLMELGPQMMAGGGHQRTAGGAGVGGAGSGGARGGNQRAAHGGGGHRMAAGMEPRRPHKSMEFLLDKENQKNVLPPENELQKLHDNNAALSEHQLRVQASLQRLNIPDWYKQYTTGAQKPATTGGAYVPGSFTKKRNSDAGSSRWAGLNSKTTSLSSLGAHTLGTDRNSPVMLSPSSHSHHGQTGFTRWSTSHLNSTQTSPSVSQRGSFSRGGTPNSSMMSSGSAPNPAGTGPNALRSSFRQPYMGWRSQEKLSQPRTPSERLASSLLARQQSKQQLPMPKATQEPAVTPEIQSSIKEVTSAIVHFVNDHTRPSHSRSRSTSPTTRTCWLESSFVGNRPLDSPQTPVIEQSFGVQSLGQAQQHRRSSDNTRINGGATNIPALSIQPTGNHHHHHHHHQYGHHHQLMSPGSTTLEDVLASLLGLPPTGAHSRSPGDSTASDAFRGVELNLNHLHIDPNSTQSFRRRSEGDAPKQTASNPITSVPPATNNSATTTAQNPDPNTSAVPLRTKPPPHATAAKSPVRRVSLDSGDCRNEPTEAAVKCRYPKCDASASPTDAKKSYKSCHNCSHMYCSRECRRAHWEKHRRACLHSRVSALCRQVLSACKDDDDTLRHLSLLARKGFTTQGRGVVRILFRSPESAENFVKLGFQSIGEATYVRWPELLPQEMGAELYSELLRLSIEYKTESKMLVYVAVCVVSETPGSVGTGAVKWERQLVSRCAKLKLSKAIISNHTEVLLPAQPTKVMAAADDATGVPSKPEVADQSRPLDVLILTFTAKRASSHEQRVHIQTNILSALRQRGVSVRKHFPEVFQRLGTYVEGTAERFAPVTIHPRDATTGRTFICLIMPRGETEADLDASMVMPEGLAEHGNVQVVDCLAGSVEQ